MRGITRFAIICVGLLLAAAAAWWFVEGGHEEPAEARIALDPVLAQKFIETLTEPGASAERKAYALMELARAGDDHALASGLPYLDAGTPVVLRAATAEALGYFTGARALTALRALLHDSEEAVRVRAVEGLCHVKGRARGALIDRIAADVSRPAPERIAAIGCRRSTEGLLIYVRGADATSARLALSRLFAVAPDEGQTLSAALEMIEKSKDDALIVNSLLHLAPRRKAKEAPVAATQLARLVRSPNAEVRRAVLETVHLFCPKDRWSILGELLSTEHNEGLRGAAIKAAAFMDRESARKLLAAVKAAGQLGETEAKALREAEARVLKNPYTDSCEGY